MALIGEMQYLTIGGSTYSIPTGTTVEVERNLTSGTKSATIKVDGTSYDLYAPTPNAGTVTSVRVQATSPVQSSTSTAQSSSLNTTISLANGYGDTKNPYGTKTKNYVLAGPITGNDAAPTFRALVAADIPDLSGTYLTSYTETDPVFSASAAARITATDISNWNAKVSDDKTWNGVVLNNTTMSSSSLYMIGRTSTSATNAYNLQATNTPAQSTLAMYDSNKYLKSTTPSANDNSTKVATTAFVTSAISALGSVLRYKGTKATVSALPTSGNTTGDVWHITADGSEYAWDGSTWQELGTAIDLSGYALLSGASFTGPVTFGDSVTADELTTGDLVVNGAASFTNNINANTINGVAVGSSPKFTDTTYSSLAAASEGTAVSLVTTGEKYTWNNKTSNTGTVTSITLTQGTGISIGSSGTAITTSGSRTISLATITKSDTTSTASPAHGGTFTAVDSVTYDTYGRVTGVNTKTVTLPADSNTHNTAYLYAGASNGTANAATTNGNTYLILMDGGSATTRRKISGATNVSVTSDANGNITITGPSLSGYALSSAIPTKVSQLSNDSGFITSADVPEGASAYTGTISAVSTTASVGTSNGFARGDHVHNITKDTINGALGTGSGTTKFYREDGTWATPAYTTNTDTKLQIAAVTSGTTYYPIVGANSTTAATRQYDATGIAYTGTNGTANGSNGNAVLALGNSTASTTANWKKGTVRLYGTTAYYTDLVSGAPSGNRTITFPNKTGTIALTSDIPTVPSSTGSATTGVTIADHSSTTIYGVQSSTTSVTGVSGSTTASKVTIGSSSTDYGITAAGSGSASLTFRMDTTDTKKLKVTFSHTHTAPTLGSKVPTVSASDVTVPKAASSATTVPIKNASTTTVITSNTHTVTDNGHTHTI